MKIVSCNKYGVWSLERKCPDAHVPALKELKLLMVEGLPDEPAETSTKA